MAQTDYIQRLRERLSAMPVEPPPAPWRLVSEHAVGGLTDVGFGEGSDLLLVISHAGRGVFDCLTGERVARDRAEYVGHEWHRLRAEGIGPLAGKVVVTAGLYGGGLPRVTQDGWSCTVASPDWPDEAVFLEPPGRSIEVEHRASGCVKVYQYEVRAVGFSWTGQTFVIANPSTLRIFRR